MYVFKSGLRSFIGGSSCAAILKYMLKNFKVGNNKTAVKSRVKLTLKAGVKAKSRPREPEHPDPLSSVSSQSHQRRRLPPGRSLL